MRTQRAAVHRQGSPRNQHCPAKCLLQYCLPPAPMEDQYPIRNKKHKNKLHGMCKYGNLKELPKYSHLKQKGACVQQWKANEYQKHRKSHIAHPIPEVRYNSGTPAVAVKLPGRQMSKEALPHMRIPLPANRAMAPWCQPQQSTIHVNSG